MRRAYRFMLLLYPRGHRDQFAEEMLNVFEESFAERREHPWSWSVRFAFSEVTSLFAGAASEWLLSRLFHFIVSFHTFRELLPSAMKPYLDLGEVDLCVRCAHVLGDFPDG